MNNDLISRSELLKVIPSEEIIARMAIMNAPPVEQPTDEKIIDRTYRDDPYEYMSQEPCDYCPYCKRFEKGGEKNDL